MANKMHLNLTKPSLDQEELDAVSRVLRSGWVIRGPETSAFEEEFAKYMGAKYAIATNGCTMALYLVLKEMDLRPGDEVIVPGYTFIASMSSVIFNNAVPVLAEVDDSLTLDPADVEARITPHTRAVLAVHMIGNPCDLDRLGAIAKKHDLLLLEDAAQAFGGSYHGRRLGTIGRLGAYSFNIFKTINAGDGGMVVTDDAGLYERAFGYHDQGHLPLRMGVEVGQRSVIGQNFRMNELSAAVLVAQFRKLDALIERLTALKTRFKKQILGLPGLEFRRLNDPEGECHTLLTVFLPDRRRADAAAQKLGTTTVAHSGWHVYNNMENILGMKTINPKNNPLKHPLYKGRAEYRKGMLPKTDGLLERAINISVGVVDRGLGSAFGINLESSDAEVDAQAQTFRKVVEQL